MSHIIRRGVSGLWRVLGRSGGEGLLRLHNYYRRGDTRQFLAPCEEGAMDGTVQERGAEMRGLHARIAPRFELAEPHRRALSYVRALLGPVTRENS